MNIALPALVILLGLLPGIVFYYAYFAGRLEKRRVAVSAMEEAALYVVFAIPINAVALWTFSLLNVHLDLNLVAHILTGNVPEQVLRSMSSRLADNVLLTAGSYVGVIVTSAAAGTVLRRVVLRLRLDTHFPILRVRHSWYYVFHGRRNDLPPDVLAWVYILVEHGEEGTRLYRGLVMDYDMGSDGQLESIVLLGAMRGRGRGPDFTWTPIPGDVFVVLGRTIHSINVEYWLLDDTPDVQELGEAEPPPPDDGPAVHTPDN